MTIVIAKRADVWTMHFFSRLKEASTLFQNLALLALLKIDVLPVGDGLPGELPE